MRDAVSPDQAAPSQQAGRAEAVPHGEALMPRRWTGDAWLLLRGNGPAIALATGFPSYGASQAGAVLRYDLRPGDPYRPQAYLRAAGAIGAGVTDRQLAAGIAVRPVPGVPVALFAEGRVQQGTVAVRVRPAVALVSELAPQGLPFGAEADVYAQAGWVGGQAATPFFDLQATAVRTIARSSDRAIVQVGGGMWSGGQKGAARVDVGPRVDVRMRVGGQSVQAAADWRFRLVGRATPGSGPALTITTGF